jgi:GH15 family glucan-1,4-alpha-glucosidase
MYLSRRVGWRIGLPIAVMMVAVVGIGATPPQPTVLPLRADGVTVNGSGAPVAVPPDSGERHRPDTSVLASAVDEPVSRALAVSDRRWLAEGTRPGSGTRYADMATRALLDLRALTSPSGAVMAAPVTAWKHVWPRDASFAAAAFAATGHHADAKRILSFLARVAPEDGRWKARYLVNGSGSAPDDRGIQLDGGGWVTWAVWTCVQTAPDEGQAAELLRMMRPAVIDSADAIAALIDDDGMPPPSPDYWERSESEVTLGLIAPMWLGLRSAIELAPDLDVDVDAWRAAERRLEGAITREFADNGYPRTIPDGGLDAAVAFLAPPFAPVEPDLRQAVITAEQALRVPNGGHRPGESWTKDVEVAWTPETAMLALALAGNGAGESARQLLTFLDDHRTALGALPEKVDSTSAPASVAPLAWTAALVVLALVELEEGLPVVPR